MDDQYFNIWEFKRALEMTEIDPFVAKKMYEDYLSKYPSDYSAHAFYCSVLIILNELNEAEQQLNKLEKKYSEDENFVNSLKFKMFYQNFIFTKIKFLTYTGKYEELYKCCIDNIEEMRLRGMNSVIFYAKKKLGKLNPSEREVNSYLFRQIVDYKEEDFYDHIKKHLADYNDNVEEPNSAVFEPDFPIKDIVEEIKKYIPSDKKLLWGLYDDIYVFKYNECGRVNAKLTNYFKVVCLHDSAEFITIFPVLGCEGLPCVDLNYLNKTEENFKVKRISRIDKFNQKYKNN